MTRNWSRGNCVRIRASSARATRLAAAKRPSRAMEPLMSSSSTVAQRASDSVSWTSKSCARRRSGIPAPPRRTALTTVRPRSIAKASPNR